MVLRRIEALGNHFLKKLKPRWSPRQCFSLNGLEFVPLMVWWLNTQGFAQIGGALYEIMFLWANCRTQLVPFTISEPIVCNFAKQAFCGQLLWAENWLTIDENWLTIVDYSWKLLLLIPNFLLRILSIAWMDLGKQLNLNNYLYCKKKSKKVKILMWFNMLNFDLVQNEFIKM